jgi:hypothetical protein
MNIFCPTRQTTAYYKLEQKSSRSDCRHLCYKSLAAVLEICFQLFCFRFSDF